MPVTRVRRMLSPSVVEGKARPLGSRPRQRAALSVLSAATVLILVACGGGGAPQQAEPAPPAAATTEQAPPSAPATTLPEAELRENKQVRYLEAPDGTRRTLTVVAPGQQGGPWPVVVMLHGAGGAGPFTPTTWWAPAVARQGAVVFVPSWETAPTTSVEAFRAGATAPAGYLACAVRFARAEAERYGGDPSSVTLFGWSGGANEASMVAFADPQVPEGCLAGSGSVVPDNLVLFDGAWLLVGDEWDDILEEDPSAHDLITPWSYLEGTHRRMPVAILTSNDPGLFRSTEDLDRWFPSRDPTGEFRRDLEQQGAFDDGRLDVADVSELLFRRLQGLGFPAAFHLLPDSSHGSLSDEAYEILFDAILHPVGL